MNSKTVLFLHGFLSSSNSVKARFFKKKFEKAPDIKFHAFEFNPTPADFKYMTITGMINKVRQFLIQLKSPDIRIIGSSLGSLTGIHYAHRFGGVKKLLLLSPLLTYGEEYGVPGWQEQGELDGEHFNFGKIPLRYDFHKDGLQYVNPVPPSSEFMIIHGRRDETIPIVKSRQYADEHPEKIGLVEMDSDHTLNDRLDETWGYVKSFLLK
jgi:uncharacterized protein